MMLKEDGHGSHLSKARYSHMLPHYQSKINPLTPWWQLWSGQVIEKTGAVKHKEGRYLKKHSQRKDGD